MCREKPSTFCTRATQRLQAALSPDELYMKNYRENLMRDTSRLFPSRLAIIFRPIHTRLFSSNQLLVFLSSRLDGYLTSRVKP